jgi:regulatory protein
MRATRTSSTRIYRQADEALSAGEVRGRRKLALFIGGALSVRGRRGFGGRPRRALDDTQVADPNAARSAALALLARRDFSVAELSARLRERGYAELAVGQAIGELVEERTLNDARYAEHYVHVHAQRGQGPRRIRMDLAEAGVDATLVEAALKEGPDWSVLARDTRRRRFGEAAPSDWAERAAQARFLQYRGFSNDHIRSALGGSEADLAFDPDT